jgi:hypothetical protein
VFAIQRFDLAFLRFVLSFLVGKSLLLAILGFQSTTTLVNRPSPPPSSIDKETILLRSDSLVLNRFLAVLSPARRAEAVEIGSDVVEAELTDLNPG